MIGFLSPDAAGPNGPFVAAFQRGLSDAGYVAGRNVAIEFRWAEGDIERLPALEALALRVEPMILAFIKDNTRTAS